MKPISVTVADASAGAKTSNPIIMDYHGRPEVSLQVAVTGTVNWTVQQTLDNPFFKVIGDHVVAEGARQGYERLQRVQSGVGAAQVERLRRWGPPALVLSVLPLVGDALVLAAGWLRLDLARSMAWIALGKGLRYVVVILSMKGLLAWI